VVLEENGLLHNPDKQCLVGSSFTLRRCLAFLGSLGMKEADLRRMAEENPARLIGR